MTAARHRAIGVRTALFGAAIGFCLASTMTAGAAPAGMQPAAGGAPEASAAPGAGTTGALAPSGLPAANAPPPASAVPAASAAGTTAAADDIRDIRGPRPLASPWVLWALVGGGILAALSGYALWRWIKRRRDAPEPSDVEVALGRLEAARTLMQPGRAREFSIEVSGIVREYIERRFHVMAAHLTTHEFLHDLVLSADPALAAHRDLLGEFLESCDLAKFGGWNLNIEQMSTMLEGARRFIQSAAASGSASTSVSAAPAAATQAGSVAQATAPAGSNAHSASGKPDVSLSST
jgi:hypothetical protein